MSRIYFYENTLCLRSESTLGNTVPIVPVNLSIGKYQINLFICKYNIPNFIGHIQQENKTVLSLITASCSPS